MWNSKKKSKKENEISLPGHAPFTDIVPVAFKKPKCLVEYSEKFNSLIENFLKDSVVDEYCGKYMDAILDSLTKEAIADLTGQYEKHLHSINEIMAQREGELIKVRENIKTIEKTLEETDKHIVHFKEVFERYNYEPEDRLYG